MCSKRCKASHEQGRYCRATDFQDPSNPSTIVGHVVMCVTCILGLAFSPVYVKTAGFPCFTSLRALNCLYFPCFALEAQLQSSAAGMEGKWDSWQYLLAVHFNLSWGSAEQSRSCVILKSMYRILRQPEHFWTKMHKEKQLP